MVTPRHLLEWNNLLPLSAKFRKPYWDIPMGTNSPRSAKITPRLSMESTDMQLISRVRKKFEKLEETCMERYQGREQRVISTLNFCMTALEQLQSWALFAIFPLDEQNSDKYISFVEQRFQCVVNPLRLFLTALQRDQMHYSEPVLRQNGRRTPSPRSSECESSRDSRAPSPRTLNSSGYGESLRGSRESLRSSKDSTRDFTSNGLNSSAGMNDSGAFSDHHSDSLRDRISSMSNQYIEEGQTVRKAVMAKLQKCRKDMRVIYRWGQASLVDLHDVLDDSLSDELYFLVRGKMQRILSDISAFEEAADQIEKNLSQYFQNQSKEKTDIGFDAPEFVMEMPNREQERYEAMDLRLNLDEVMEVGTAITPRVGRTDRDDLDSGDSTRGSTPEPPTSPRPKGLVNHPKIMKDKLQSYALPSKFSGVRLSTPW